MNRFILSSVDQMILRRGATPPSIDIAHARIAGALPGLRKDPFDRVLIARTVVEGATIASADRVFRDDALPVRWA